MPSLNNNAYLVAIDHNDIAELEAGFIACHVFLYLYAATNLRPLFSSSAIFTPGTNVNASAKE